MWQDQPVIKRSQKSGFLCERVLFLILAQMTKKKKKERKKPHVGQIQHALIWVQDLGLMGSNLLVSQVAKLRPRERKGLAQGHPVGTRGEG